MWSLSPLSFVFSSNSSALWLCNCLFLCGDSVFFMTHLHSPRFLLASSFDWIHPCFLRQWEQWFVGNINSVCVCVEEESFMSLLLKISSKSVGRTQQIWLFLSVSFFLIRFQVTMWWDRYSGERSPITGQLEGEVKRIEDRAEEREVVNINSE